MIFGRYVFKLRQQKKLSLRDFSRLSGYDSSNLSKIERGILLPPSDKATLMKWADILDIQAEPEQLNVFFDMAAIARREIPEDLAKNEDMLAFVPAFLRTVGSRKPTREQLERVIAILKEANE